MQVIHFPNTECSAIMWLMRPEKPCYIENCVLRTIASMGKRVGGARKFQTCNNKVIFHA